MGCKSEFVPFTKVDEKGRVVLPSELRTRMDISPGDEFIVDELGPDAGTVGFGEGFGHLVYPIRPN